MVRVKNGARGGGRGGGRRGGANNTARVSAAGKPGSVSGSGSGTGSGTGSGSSGSGSGSSGTKTLTSCPSELQSVSPGTRASTLRGSGGDDCTDAGGSGAAAATTQDPRLLYAEEATVVFDGESDGGESVDTNTDTDSGYGHGHGIAAVSIQLKMMEHGKTYSVHLQFTGGRSLFVSMQAPTTSILLPPGFAPADLIFVTALSSSKYGVGDPLALDEVSDTEDDDGTDDDGTDGADAGTNDRTDGTASAHRAHVDAGPVGSEEHKAADAVPRRVVIGRGQAAKK